MRLLLTGGSGKLGQCIRMLNAFIYAPTHKEMDITDKWNVFDVIGDFKPDIVIHTAAYTDVRGAEREREKCWRVNVGGTVNMLFACQRLPVHFIYVSTACVFHGDRGNYAEDDIPYPCNFYGLTKLIGEIMVRSVEFPSFSHLVIRTNFVKRGPWPYEKAFIDRFGTYLYADEVAASILHHVSEGTTGTIHICGDKKMSMFDLAKQYSPDVQPLTLKEYYISNPIGPSLTQDMTLKSNRKDET